MISNKNQRQSQKGLSVLEALVAIALISVAFLPLLALQEQLTRTAIAIERAEETLRAKSNALAYLETLNPTYRPSGEESLGNAVLTWTSTPLTIPVPALAMVGTNGRFDVTLYDVNAVIQFQTGRSEQFVVRRVGWVATRPIGEIG